MECGFLLINKNPDVSPLTATHLPISSPLVHLGGGATAFFCSMFVSAQTLDSRTPGKCFYSFLLLVCHLPPLHLLSSLSLDYHGSGFELSLSFFSRHELVSDSPLLQCQTPPLLFFSLLALPEFSNYLPPAKDMFGILSFSWGLGVNKGAELCDCV